MQGINKVILYGRLGADPELRQTSKGKPFTRFSLAVSYSVKRDDGWEESVDWFYVTAWDHQAESISRGLKKGSPCLVEARLSDNQWQDAQGQKHRSIDIVADRVHFVGGIRNGQSVASVARETEVDDSSRGPTSQQARSLVALPPLPPELNACSDEVPF